MKIPWKITAQVVAIAIAIPFLLICLIPLAVIWTLVLFIGTVSFTFDVAFYGWDDAVVRFKRDDLPCLRGLTPWGW